VKILLGMLGPLLVLACDGGGGDERDGGTDGDADVDGDVDADADADAPPVGPDDCPRNSGWPCTCDRTTPCDDGSPCVAIPIGGSPLGVCTARCDTTQPVAAQCPDHDFGAAAWCQLRESATGPPTHCLLVCAVPEVCPSDQTCADPGLDGVPGYCVPE
jgi:hypothetical protein